MKAAWTHAVILLAGSLLALAVAVWMFRAAQAQASLPDEFVAVRERLMAGISEMGGKKYLDETHTLLEGERTAMSSDAELFSRRVGDAFDQLGLAVMTSSSWRVAPEFETSQAVAFERTFSGVGNFDALVDVIRTIEGWPDRARLRSLLVVPDAAGSVYFSFDIAVVRLRLSDNRNEES